MQVFATIIFVVLAYWLTRLNMMRHIKALQENLSSSEQTNLELLVEIDERSKENMQLVMSLTNIEARRVNRGLTSNRSAFDDLQGRFNAIAIVQRQLAHRTTTNTIPACTLFKEIINQQINRPKYSVHCEVETDHLEIGVLLAGPLGLILHEISGQATSGGDLDQAREIRVTLDEQKGSQLIDFKVCFSESTEVEKEDTLSDDIIAMLSDQIAATIVKSSEKEYKQWCLSYAKHKDDKYVSSHSH